MSWDVLLQRFPKSVTRPEEMPDDYRPPALGSRSQVARAIRRLIPSADISEPACVTIAGRIFTIELSLGKDEECSQMLLHIRGDHGEAIRAVIQIARHWQMRALDCSSGEFLDSDFRGLAGPSSIATAREKADERRYGREIEEWARKGVELPKPPLGGLVKRRCAQYIYLGLKAGETVTRQQKAVFSYWKGLYRKYGENPTAVHGPHWLLTLPEGESFGGFYVARFPASATETEEQMVPLVDRAASLLREFASATGRSSGTIEDESVFVAADGRRVPLAECAYRQVITDADMAIKGKRRK